jgi:XTP/dITP diphosphohydrolase
MKRLVIATHNRKKAGEMEEILARRFPHLELRTLADYPGAPEPEETGATYAENAAIKSRSAARATGEWSIADDAGLEVDALDGVPGLYSKRFGGEDLPFTEKMALLLSKLVGVPDEQRTARFRCCVALTSPSGEDEVFEAACEGRIATERKGEGGFGYDPVFFLPELGRHMAELTPEEKHAISHRGKVLAMAGDRIQNLLDQGKSS